MDVFDGLLFDLDGTLWDSVDAICISWNRALERLAPEYAGTVTRARLLPCMGMLLPDILHRLVPELDQERMKPILEEVLSEENAYVAAHGGVLYPEVEQTLAALSARCPLFLVSNCQDGYIEAFSRPMDWGAILRTTKTPAARGCPRRTTSPWWRSGTA
ncbi:MAG: HAD family hydrolase [Flavonifractor plautii]